MHRFLWLLLLVAILGGCFAPAAQPVGVSEPGVSEAPATVARPDPNAVVAISYDDLNLPMEPDTLFQEWMLTQRVRDLDGKRVRIKGYMCGAVQFTSSNIKRFIMLREKECPYGPGGQAHHVIAVSLNKASARFTDSIITVEGVLSVRPFTGDNDKTWAVYALDDAELK